MLALLLVFFSTFFDEVAASMGKRREARGEQSVYMMGFLNMFWATVFFFFIAFFFRKAFLFSFDSLPTFLPRAVLEVVQAHVTFLAITKAERSTFGFVRTLTLPLLLGVDVVLGYAIGFQHFLGIGLIVASLVLLFTARGIGRNGAWLTLFSAVNAVITISLFKYNITHFNSVEAEEGIITLLLVAYFAFMAAFVAKEDLTSLFRRPAFLVQSLAQGIGSVVISFAYLLAPASVITTGKRSFSVLWSVVSGSVYFGEGKLFLKIGAFLLIAAGLVLLVL